MVLANRENYNFYITTDLASSNKKSAHLSVIDVWAYNHNRDWLWVDGICKQQLIDKSIDDIFRFVSMYNPQKVGIEVTGQQNGYIRWLQREMVSRNIFFSFATDSKTGEPGIRPSIDKITRFMVVLPLFKQKKIWFPKDRERTDAIIEKIDELKKATIKGFKSRYDDAVDSISQLPSMNPWEPNMGNNNSVQASNTRSEDKYYIQQTFDDDDDTVISSYIY
jgi:predicted phage terminase large subunit-like protein